MSDYWERRAARDMWQYMEDAEKTAEEIKKLYQRGYRYLAEEINQIFERFRDAHNLTDEEARQLLNTMQSPTDIHELREKLKQTADGEEKAELLAKLESAAYQHRIQRLQSLVNQIDTIMHQTYKAELKIAEDACQRLAEDVYYKTIYQVQKQTGLSFSFSLIDDAAIKKAMSLKWYGKNYSERIWVNTDRLAEKLKEELMVNFITGRTNREAAESVQFEFAKGMQNARRLVRTESCYLANQMEMQSYEECEIEKYRFVATLDLRTSDICRELDGKVFLVSEQQPGKNCPPMHPYCRSTTTCDITPEELATMKRRAKDPETGKTKLIPANMTYEQWYDKYVKGHPDAELNEKMIRNRSSDRKQFERYKDILGKYAPETLEEFQRMKYNEAEKWSELKEAYQDANWQKKALKNLKSGEMHSAPFEQEASSVFDNYRDGKIVQRRYYGKTGKPRLDIDMTDHGNPKEHPVVPHYHGWNELQNGKLQREGKHDNELKLGYRIANADILKGDE